jgi:Reverse transcriptase (RNA-dependent DNA polymerase)
VERKRSAVNSIVGQKCPTVTFSDSVRMCDVVVERGTVVPVYPSTEDHRGDSVIFSAEVYNHCEGFSDRHVLLDTCAGESVFKCRNLFYFVEPSAAPMIISGVNPKGNPLVINECGETDFGFVYYDPKCIANILSFGNVVNSSESVTYNNRHDCYVVQVKPGGVCYRFSRDPVSNIYLCDLDTMLSEPRLAMVVTVSEKMKKYSKRQVRQAELAREYQRKLGYASPGQLIKMIGQGQLAKSGITAQDVVRSVDIWGPDLGSLKGKTTSHKAQLEEELPVVRTKQFESQTMYLDLMFVNGLPFLIAVVNPLEYVMVNKLSKRDNWTLWGSLESNINHITKYGFKINMIRVDGEGAISTEWFENRVSSKGIILDTTGAGEAVAVVERKIRLVKERVRAITNTLPYTLTEKLEGWLVRYVVNRIVLVPTRNTVDYVCPREKLFGRKIDVEKELKHGFGDYVQVHADTVDNSMKPRTQGAIALMSAGNLEGSWFYMLLSNLSVVKRTKATPLPMSDEVIAHLNSLSVNRKINKTSNHKQPIFEQNKRLISDNDEDYHDDNYTQDMVDNIEPTMIQPYDLPYDDEHVAYDLENEFDVPDEMRDEIPGHYESDDIVNQLLEEIDNDADNDFTEYDDTPVNNQALLDDIFGIDSDDDIDIDIDNNDEMSVEPHVEIEPAVVPVLRRSARNHQPGKWDKKYVGVNTFHRDMSLRTFVLNMTISESIDKFGDTAVDSINKEIKQMLEKNVWDGVMLDSLTTQQKKSIITSSMFGKAKYAADGTFDKFKSRIVAGGHQQDRDIYDNGSSPTVSTTSVFIVAAIAAMENRAVATIDFPGAFLNSDMPLEGDHVVFMRINKYLTNVLTSIDPSYKKFVNANGTCVVKLKKALYGCVESAKLWYDKISSDLTNLGFKRNETDICVFNRIEINNKQTTLVIHVDDMMITSTDNKNVDKILVKLKIFILD